MAQQTRDQLKQWFETGDYPTQQQFWDWLDSYRHMTDPIAISDILNLLTTLQSKADKSVVDSIVNKPDEMQLNVTTEGQTVFNIYTMPNAKTVLDINGITYFQDMDYSIGTDGVNVILTWNNSFSLSIMDMIILLKF